LNISLQSESLQTFKLDDLGFQTSSSSLRKPYAHIRSKYAHKRHKLILRFSHYYQNQFTLSDNAFI
jgi:hypothetical protein